MQQALDLIARLIVRPGENVWIEDPAYPGAVDTFQRARAKLVPVRVDEKGLDPVAARSLARRARALVPVLQERAQHCEAERRVPAETIADFRRAGLLQMCQPARYGGYEHGWDVLCDVGEVLAAACGGVVLLYSIWRGDRESEKKAEKR